MNTEIINQKTDRDCVIASFAMWLKKPYEEITTATPLEWCRSQRQPDAIERDRANRLKTMMRRM